MISFKVEEACLYVELQATLTDSTCKKDEEEETEEKEYFETQTHGNDAKN